MPAIRLEHNGLSLEIPYKNKHLYLEKEFEPGKNLYQIVFEYLVDGRELSIGELIRKYRSKHPQLGHAPIWFIIKRIKSAQEKSLDPRVKALSFVRPSRGGARPVISRKSVRSRYTPEQKATIESVVKALHENGKRPSDRAVKLACIRALSQKGLLQNVKLHPLRIRAIKIDLNLLATKRRK